MTFYDTKYTLFSLFQMASNVLSNPWAVDSVSDFTFICCPECIFRTKEEPSFQAHALQNHPQSKTLFLPYEDIQQEDIIISEVSLQEDSIGIEEDQDIDAPEDEVTTTPAKPKISMTIPIELPTKDNEPEMRYLWEGKPHPGKTCHKCTKIVHPASISGHIKKCDGILREGANKAPKRPHAQKNNIAEADIKHEEDGKVSVKEELIEDMDIDETDTKPGKLKQCYICASVVKNLTEHMRDVHPSKDQQVKCDQCDQVFKTKKYLKKHEKNVHSSIEDEVQCVHCGFVAKNKIYLSQHRCKTIPTTPKPKKPKISVICDDCGKTLSSESSLGSHKRQHCNPGGYTCKECDLNYKSKTFYVQHMESLHPDVKLDIEPLKESQKRGKLRTCQECSMEFTTANTYYTHYKNTHGKVPPDYEGKEVKICYECGDTFASKFGLDKHLKNKHGQGAEIPEAIVCDKCDKTFYKKMIYVVHHRNAHGSMPEGYEDVKLLDCTKCPKGFASKGTLIAHIKLKHTERRTYMCSHCDKTFSTPSGLHIHYKDKHDENAKSFRCPFEGCEDRTFPTNGRLQTHIGNKHRKVACEHCEKEVSTPFSLKKHMFAAHGIVPKDSKKCLYCSMYFETDYAMNNHLKKKHNKE